MLGASRKLGVYLEHPDDWLIALVGQVLITQGNIKEREKLSSNPFQKVLFLFLLDFLFHCLFSKFFLSKQFLKDFFYCGFI